MSDCTVTTSPGSCQVTLSGISKSITSVTFTPTAPTGLPVVTVFKP